MSLNPARSFGPAVVSGHFASLWIYFTAPVAGMALAAEVFIRTRGRTTACPSLHHGPSCRFCSAKEIA
jgi:aquaporin Z